MLRFRLFFPAFILFFLVACGGDGEKKAADSTGTNTTAIRYPLPKNADSLVLLLAQTGKDTNRVNILNYLAWQLSRNYPDSAIAYGQMGLHLSEEIGFRLGVARALHNTGWAHNQEGNYDTAAACLQRSLTIFREEKNQRGEIAALNALGTVYLQQADYDQALSSFFPAMELSEKAGNRAAVMTLLSNTGMIYSMQGNTTKALENFYKARSMAEADGNSVVVASYYINLGKVYGDLKEYDSVLVYNRKALAIKEETDDKNGQATCYNNIAQAYLNKNQLAQAIEYNAKAITLQQEIGDKKGAGITMVNMAQADAVAGKYADGIRILQDAMALARETGARDLALSCLDAEAELRSQMGDYRNAYEIQRRYSLLKDSLLNETNSQHMAELQTKYETEKKDREIDLLNANNALQDAEIRKSKAEADQQQTRLNAFIIGFVLVLLLAIAILLGLRQKQRINRELEKKNAQIGEKNKNITDSINYARRIQRALLTTESYLRSQLPDYFVLNRPKDIVSGDFYWAVKTEDGKLFLATADCTGHGVPGAFMSLIGISLLNEIVNGKKIRSAGKVLDQLRDDIIRALNPEGAEEISNDGMDIAFCCYDFRNMTLEYAGANNGLYLLRNNELKEYEPDRMPVGRYAGETKPFTVHTIPLEKGDIVYTFTDGYADQFGGPSGKKFKYRQLKETLLLVSQLPMDAQREKLAAHFDAWKGKLEQIDDVLLVGVKVNA